MAYTPINFKNKQPGGTPVSAQNLNHMEDGIVAANNLVPTDSGSVGQVLTKTAVGTAWQNADAFPSEGTTGQVLTKADNGVEWSDAGNPTDAQVAEAVTDWLDENITEIPATAPIVDSSLTVQGAAADAKKTGDEISELKSQIAQGGLTEDIKIALMNLVNHVGFDDDDPTGKTYIDALYDALYPPTNLSYITAVYSGGSVDEYASLDSLKSDLVVTAHYDDLTTETVTTYALSGSLEVGTSTITVSYSGETTTFDVTVTEGRLPSEYTEVEYLSASQSSSSNGAFIDTGVGFSSPTLATYRVGMQNASKSGMTEGQYFIGTRETGTGTSNNIGWGCQVYSTDKKTIISWAGSPGARFEPENQYEYHDIVATYKSTEVTIAGDDDEPVVLTQTMRSIGGYNIGVFGLPSNTGNGATYLYNGKIYYAQAEQDGVLLFDLIPCTRNADSKPGMWDRVSKTFLTATKAGSGSTSAITAGPAVSA